MTPHHQVQEFIQELLRDVVSWSMFAPGKAGFIITRRSFNYKSTVLRGNAENINQTRSMPIIIDSFINNIKFSEEEWYLRVSWKHQMETRTGSDGWRRG